MQFHKHTLPNGLQIIAETSPSARSVALGFFVRTGARDETADVSGVTHFLEHMIFKGTPNRTALEVNRDFDRIGADYNAFTSEENTVFHAAVLPEYVPRAVDILADILRPSLRDEDFDVEKKVIIEEIGMYEDQPMFAAHDNARRLFFEDHRLGNSILGTVQSITDLKRDQMHTYFRRRYIAPNILVAVAGRIDWDKFRNLIEEKCGAWESGPVGRDCLRPAPGSGKFEIMTREKLIQEHVILMAAGPAADDPLRHAADLLAMAVGDDSGSRLYWELVDPGLADSADCGFHEYEGTGSFYTSFSGEPENAAENLKSVLDVLHEVQAGSIRDDELEQARNKLLSRLVRVNERPKGRMQSIGMAWMYQREYRSVDDDLRAYQNVTLNHVRAVLDRFPIDKVTTLALGPLAKLPQP
jgi:predicted Zn-dependent peptidase